MVVFSKATVVLAALSAVASAVPTTNRHHRGFSIRQISKQVTPKAVNLPGVYANSLRKFGGAVPYHVKAAAERGSAVTTPEANDIAYLTPVTIGNSTLNLDLDTGSADL